VVFAPSSRSRLTTRDLGRFPGESLFDCLAREVCRAGCLPRKEMYESWEVARRVRRLLRGGRVVDVAGGHGLLAQAMLILDDSSPSALVVDRELPLSAARLHAQLLTRWPRLSGRVTFLEDDLGDVGLLAGDVVVSCHACGALTDRILERAVAARASVAVLPCCHDLARCDTAGVTAWVDGPVAVDVVRALRLRAAGFRTWAQTIPSGITPKNRLLVGAPG
jgi:hypothetical protein